MFDDFLTSLNPILVSAVATAVLAVVAVLPHIISKIRNANFRVFRIPFRASFTPHRITAVAAILTAIATIAIAVATVFSTYKSFSTYKYEEASTPDSTDEDRRISRCRNEMVRIPSAHYPLTHIPLPDGYLDSLYVKQVTIERAFYIDRDEVTMSEFNDFLQTLTPEKRSKLGLDRRWEEDVDYLYEEHKPLDKISWKAANAYVQRQREKTGCSLELPSSIEWIAALMYSNNLPRDQRPDGLLEGPDEWSRDSCARWSAGHWILGVSRQENPRSAKAECYPGNLSTSKMGFRMVYRDDW
uniref:Sulfatase-modifying factor enzyme 1 n=1 Tax=Candidatus Kentrum sp. FW TaxID=2126338 RepID=A0A450SYC8_9GAMM|nr:MAG: Sulfatase-modifying factor enzyme 1 [Candidatus Kentron sp. FW]